MCYVDFPTKINNQNVYNRLVIQLLICSTRQWKIRTLVEIFSVKQSVYSFIQYNSPYFYKLKRAETAVICLCS